MRALATAQGDSVDMPPTEYIALVSHLELSRTHPDAAVAFFRLMFVGDDLCGSFSS